MSDVRLKIHYTGGCVEATYTEDQAEQIIDTLRNKPNAFGLFTAIPSDRVDFHIPWRSINAIEVCRD